MCNELGEAGAGWTLARPASVDQVHTKNNRHTPVMVYDDLMINKHTVICVKAATCVFASVDTFTGLRRSGITHSLMSGMSLISVSLHALVPSSDSSIVS